MRTTKTTATTKPASLMRDATYARAVHEERKARAQLDALYAKLDACADSREFTDVEDDIEFVLDEVLLPAVRRVAERRAWLAHKRATARWEATR